MGPGDLGEIQRFVHDAFLQIWRRAASFDPARGAARPWVYAIVRNRALTILRGEPTMAAMTTYGDPEVNALVERIDLVPDEGVAQLCCTIEAELEAARKRGWHQSDSEYIADLAGVSMPLPYADRRLSIVVAGPVSRCLARRPQTAASIRRMMA